MWLAAGCDASTTSRFQHGATYNHCGTSLKVHHEFTCRYSTSSLSFQHIESRKQLYNNSALFLVYHRLQFIILCIWLLCAICSLAADFASRSDVLFLIQLPKIVGTVLLCPALSLSLSPGALSTIRTSLQLVDQQHESTDSSSRDGAAKHKDLQHLILFYSHALARESRL